MNYCIGGIPAMKTGLFVLILTLIISAGIAQPQQIRFKKLSIEEGLSQSTVETILNDSEGYMWFGTRDGLNRYDGNKIIVYHHNPKDSTSISSSEINHVFEDKANNLWIATTRGIDRFDRQKEIFIHYRTNKGDIDASRFVQDKKGNLWLASWDGLYKFNARENRFMLFHIQPDTIRMDVPQIMEDNQGFLWINSLWFIAKFDPLTERLKYYFHDPNNPKSLSFGPRPFTFQDKDGNIWIGSIGGGLCLYNPADDSFTRYLHDPANPNSLCHNEVLSITQAENGELWIGTQNGGISIFDYKKNRFKTLKKDISNSTTLSNNSIHCLYRDRSNNMWVGTWAGGVNLFSRYGNKFTNYNGVLNFDNPNIYAVKGDAEGNIWIGVEDGGLVSFDRETANFTFYPNQHAGEFLTNVIFSISEYNKDTLAIGYHRGSFAFFDKRKKLFTHYFAKKGEPNNATPSPPIPGNLIGFTKTCILKDHEGNLWITDWGFGVNVLDKKSKKFTNYFQDLKDNTSLNGTQAFVVYEDKQGNIWIGTDKGLNRFDKKSKRFIRYQKKSRFDYGVSNTVFSLFEDSRGIFWVGTSGEGLMSLDRKTNQFVRHAELEALPNNVINGILEDDKGNLWISTNKGISRYNPIKKTIRNYDVKDGLQGNEFNRNACYKAPDGFMFFAGTNGFNVFHPDSIHDNPHLPSVVITGFQLFNKPVLPAEAGSVLKTAINETREITLSYKHSVFSFEFAALDFTLPANNQYAYIMEGFDKDWIYAGNRHTATYTNLDPGTYTFRVKASNNDGMWNEQGTFIIIHILPPWWMTAWFKAAAVLFLGGTAIGYYKLRMRAIKRQNRKLENSVVQRTHQLQMANEEISKINTELMIREEEIKVQNEELAARNNELVSKQEEIASQRDLLAEQNQKLNEARETIEAHNQILDLEVRERTKELVAYNHQLEQFAFIAAHNLRGPVARILGLGQVMELSQNKPDDERIIFNKLIITTQELDRVVKDLNTILEIRNNNKLDVSEINLEEELRAVQANLTNEITETKAEIRADFTAINTIHGVKPYIYSILFNLISNAIKYRHPDRTPCIILQTATQNGYICLEVKDNGLGIDLGKHQQQLFNLYKRFHTHVEGKGMGLYLVKTHAEAMGGKIEVESQVNMGTSFKIFLKDIVAD
ncbi:two-component regulator propeller domain-containing protein [Ohtaekwangia sp.]|uniref:two-component regulator propeller domain-containing protein n=1 Tax=Ohtaekwangia sp. TaxID=2066019 RepID=UPI002FDE26C2